MKKTKDLTTKSKRNKGGQPDNKNAEKWTEEKAIALGQSLLSWLSLEGDDHIFFEEFLYLKNFYHPNTIKDLEKKYKSFQELIDKARKIQEIKLKKYGTMNSKVGLNPGMTKFCLINNHGYLSERQMVQKEDITKEQKTKKDVYLIINELNKKNKEISKRRKKK
ncbi:MAG: hypothetical protein ACFFE4_00555 [Candidatus Thorarchaeota archaeon]